MVTDLNDRIAIAKGWRLSEWYEDPGVPGTRSKTPLHTHWYNPAEELEVAGRPDFTGTLEGVAGMLRELANAPEGIYMLAPQATGWVCAVAGRWKPSHFSATDRPGDCVGEAYMSMFGKEADDGT